METNLKFLLEKVDEIHQEAYKHNKWQMQVVKQQQEKAKYIHQRVIMIILFDTMKFRKKCSCSNCITML